MVINIKTVNDFDVNKKTVILRCDLNVSIKNNKIIDDTRITEALETINYLLQNNAKVVILSHLGRVTKEEDKKNNSLKVVYNELNKKLKNKIKFIPYTRNEIIKEEINNLDYGNGILLENTRFEDVNGKKESQCDDELAKYWASLGDIFINDAFGTIHRKHASNYGIAKNMNSGIGFLIEKEINNLKKLDKPKRPFAIFLGGSKISDKIELINSMITKVDYLFIGGAMSFTFLKAKNINVGKSLYEENMIDVCKDLLTKYSEKIILPVDFFGSSKFSNLSLKKLVSYDKIPDNFIGMDIGDKTVLLFKEKLNNVKTVFINGPLGVYEFSKYQRGTKEIIKYLNLLNIETYVGGGDIVSLIKKLKLEKNISYISTGGGATLAFLANHKLENITILDK